MLYCSRPSGRNGAVRGWASQGWYVSLTPITWPQWNFFLPLSHSLGWSLGLIISSLIFSTFWLAMVTTCSILLKKCCVMCLPCKGEMILLSTSWAPGALPAQGHSQHIQQLLQSQCCGDYYHPWTGFLLIWRTSNCTICLNLFLSGLLICLCVIHLSDIYPDEHLYS